MNTEKILAVIPARGGSKSLPGKNIRPLAGHGNYLGHKLDRAPIAVVFPHAGNPIRIGSQRVAPVDGLDHRRGVAGIVDEDRMVPVLGIQLRIVRPPDDVGTDFEQGLVQDEIAQQRGMAHNPLDRRGQRRVRLEHFLE